MFMWRRRPCTLPRHMFSDDLLIFCFVDSLFLYVRTALLEQGHHFLEHSHCLWYERTREKGELFVDTQTFLLCAHGLPSQPFSAMQRENATTINGIFITTVQHIFTKTTVTLGFPSATISCRNTTTSPPLSSTMDRRRIQFASTVATNGLYCATSGTSSLLCVRRSSLQWRTGRVLGT